MSLCITSKPIPAISTVTARARQPDMELLALLANPAPLTSEQWAWVRQFEEAADAA